LIRTIGVMLFVEAGIWLVIAHVAVRLPFGVIAKRLRSPGHPVTRSPGDARHISRAIGAISRRIPFTCLEQSIAAKLMLRVRGVPNTLYLGFAGAKAHAWLESGSFVVTGGENAGRYAVVTSFRDGP